MKHAIDCRVLQIFDSNIQTIIIQEKFITFILFSLNIKNYYLLNT